MLVYKTYENVRDADFWRAVICELIGTALLVLIGCGSIVLHIPGVVITTSADIVRVALAFGLTVAVLVKAFGPASGCHINPAVSLGLLSVGRISVIRAFFYIIAQLIGSVLGAGMLYGIVPDDKKRSLGLTYLSNGITEWQGMGSEIIFTAVLTLVISSCIDERRDDNRHGKSTNPLIIGLTVTVLHLMAIPYTGASLNPARTFGPSLVGWYWSSQWVYWAGPIVGGCLGAIAYRGLVYPVKPDSCKIRSTISTISDETFTTRRGVSSMESQFSVISTSPSMMNTSMMNNSQAPLVSKH